MSEISRIRNNNNGEKPLLSKYSILHVDGLEQPAPVLQAFKDAVIACLENDNLAYDDPQWAQLLPNNIVSFAQSLTDEDFARFDYTFTLDGLVDNMLDEDIRTWRWHSSSLHEKGFEVYFQGEFSLHHLPLVWYQGVRLKHLSFESSKGEITTIPVLKDAVAVKLTLPD